MTAVAAAVIYNEKNEVLICRRPPGKNCALLFEFPGGKVEAGEGLEEALVRECAEELGIVVTVGKPLGSSRYAYPDITVEITFFAAKIKEGTPIAKEQQTIVWAAPDGLREYPFCPGDKAFVATLARP